VWASAHRCPIDAGPEPSYAVSMAKKKSEVIEEADGSVRVTLDEDGENWMAEHRLEQLRARGWKGSVMDYLDEFERIGGDPLEQTPPIKRARQ
jgi:hypothetical protein